MRCFSKSLFHKLDRLLPELPARQSLVTAHLNIYKRWEMTLTEYVRDIFPASRKYYGNLVFLQEFGSRVEKVARVSAISAEMERAPLSKIVKFDPFAPFAIGKEADNHV
jgi:hypothetical protein